MPGLEKFLREPNVGAEMGVGVGADLMGRNSTSWGTLLIVEVELLGYIFAFAEKCDFVETKELLCDEMVEFLFAFNTVKFLDTPGTAASALPNV